MSNADCRDDDRKNTSNEGGAAEMIRAHNLEKEVKINDKNVTHLEPPTAGGNTCTSPNSLNKGNTQKDFPLPSPATKRRRKKKLNRVLPKNPSEIPLPKVETDEKEPLFQRKKKKKKKGKKDILCGLDNLNPENTAPPPMSLPFVDKRKGPRPGDISNKLKRTKIFIEQKRQKQKDQVERRQQRKSLQEKYGDAAPKIETKTIDDCRIGDGTDVTKEDDEVKCSYM